MQLASMKPTTCWPLRRQSPETFDCRCRVLTDWWRQLHNNGIAEGIVKAIAQGIAKGVAMSNNNETGGAAGQKPGNGFVRPGIDDRPDLDKALTPEQKEAVSRLAVPLPKKAKSEDSAASVGVQETRMVAESGTPVAAMASSVDAAVLDPNSAFNDMRDPMVSADGHRPSKAEILRLGIGFTLSAVACAIPWVALSTVILPQVLENINPATKESMLGTINAVGSIVALLANVIFGTLSDMTRSRFGKRSPWIVLGGLIAGLSVGLIAVGQHSFPAILVLWCCAQLGYNIMLARSWRLCPTAYPTRSAVRFPASMVLASPLARRSATWSVPSSTTTARPVSRSAG